MKKKPIKYYRPITPYYFDVGRRVIIFTLYTEKEKQQHPFLNEDNILVYHIEGRYQLTSPLTKINRKTGEFWTMNSHYIPKEPQ